jgi:nucleoside-diphosphate-sugar epimerase
MVEVLITGSSGFTGTALRRRLSLEPGFRVNLVSRREPPKDVGASKRYFPNDFREAATASAILKEVRPDWIFHLAGALKGSATELFQANVQNTIHLLDAAATFAPNARILLVGSAAEYGIPENDLPISEEHTCRPMGPYGVSKHAMTLAGLDFSRRTNLQVNVARAFNLIGPGVPESLLLGAVIQRARQALATEQNFITVGDVSPQRDFIDVRDAAEAYVVIMKSRARSEVFNVCSGTPTIIRDLVKTALSFTLRPLRYEIDQNLGSGGAKSVIGDRSKLGGLGFQPRFSLDRSIEDACAPLRS